MTLRLLVGRKIFAQNRVFRMQQGGVVSSPQGLESIVEDHFAVQKQRRLKARLHLLQVQEAELMSSNKQVYYGGPMAAQPPFLVQGGAKELLPIIRKEKEDILAQLKSV